MSMTQEEFDNAVLEVTSGPNWDILIQGLRNDIYHTQTHVFDASDWGGVMELKGFARGLAYVINLRTTIQATISAEKANANL